MNDTDNTKDEIMAVFPKVAETMADAIVARSSGSNWIPH